MPIQIAPGQGIIIGNNIRNSVSSLCGQDLASPDASTTLTANQSAQNAFSNSQILATTFSAAITGVGDFLSTTSIRFRDTDAANAAAVQSEGTNPGTIHPGLQE